MGCNGITTKKTKLNKQKNEEIQSIKQNIELVQEMDGKISLILDETISVTVTPAPRSAQTLRNAQSVTPAIGPKNRGLFT